MPSYYRSQLAGFLKDQLSEVIGQLATESARAGFTDLKQKQTKAWQKQILALKSAGAQILSEIQEAADWILLVEYPIARRQKRIDAVLLARDVIFCLEFKTEQTRHDRQTQRQVEDYALDLRDFHEESRGRRIVPFAITLSAGPDEQITLPPPTDLVRPVVLANGANLATKIIFHYKEESEASYTTIDGDAWDLSAYRPVPTIIEAAEALYGGHNVREIAHSHAGAINLTLTSDKLIEIIQRAQIGNLKVVCCVTGVPGAGKTLAGLNVVHNPVLREDGRPPGVFLSGNGPLVRVVSAAIARDFKRRTRTAGAERTTSTFIQNVHAFVGDSLDKPERPPTEHVIVFDEAQRAWNAAHNAKKTGSVLSEPETILSIMDRHSDWAVIVAIVGGGQEIHTGEAGLAEWGRSIRERFPHWQVAVSPKALIGDTSVAGQMLFANGSQGSLVVNQEPSLHLEVTLRSFRARRLAEWVDAALSGDAPTAASIATDLADFPIALTRSVHTARAWLSERTRGLRRCGLVASSGATRLRSEGIELSSGFRRGNRDLYLHWFLAEPSDVRSSNRLEIAASEFECQGLELDFVGLCWGGDFTFDSAKADWVYRWFSANGWRNVVQAVGRQYLVNKYRVLLTRAREGMIIWVPRGDSSDSTRPSEWFEGTAEFLEACGLKTV